MEGVIPKNWRILAATLFSVVLIAGAYVLAREFNSPELAQASTEIELLKAIAAKDSNGDGLPDWEKSLYGIPVNSTTTDYFNLGMTDGEAVARGLIVPKAVANISVATGTESNNNHVSEGTFTASFSQNFLELYLAAKQANGGADLSASQTSVLSDRILNQLSQSFSLTVPAKTVADLKVYGTGPDALRAFATAAEEVFKKNMDATATTNELQTLKDAVQNGNVEALAQLASAAQIYRNYAAGLAVLPVPQELAADDLALINTMLLRGTVDSYLAQVNTDPLAAIAALQQFSQTESAFWNEFSDIGAIYASAGVVLPAEASGAAFVNFINNVHRTTS